MVSLSADGDRLRLVDVAPTAGWTWESHQSDPSSLVVALTVTPVLCRLLLARTGERAHGEGFLVRWLKARYGPSLQWALRRGKLLLVDVSSGVLIWLRAEYPNRTLSTVEGLMTRV